MVGNASGIINRFFPNILELSMRRIIDILLPGTDKKEGKPSFLMIPDRISCLDPFTDFRYKTQDEIVIPELFFI